MLATLVFFAQEEASEPSRAPFYIASGVLVAFALLLAAVGIARHETFPPSRGLSALLALLCVVLVGVTMFTSVITG